MSKPFQPASSRSAGTTLVSASSVISCAITMSVGSTIRPSADASSLRQVSTISASSSESPTSRPCAARKVKHMPPPMSSMSTLGSSA